MPDIPYGPEGIPQISSPLGGPSPTQYMVPGAHRCPHTIQHLDDGSAVIAQLTVVSNRHTNRQTTLHP